MKSGYFPGSVLLGHCGVAAGLCRRPQLPSSPATPFFSVVTHPPSGLVSHIHLISLNPVHTLLNDSFVKVSLRITSSIPFVSWQPEWFKFFLFFPAICYYFLTSSFLNPQHSHSVSLFFFFFFFYSQTVFHSFSLKILPDHPRIQNSKLSNQSSLASPPPPFQGPKHQGPCTTPQFPLTRISCIGTIGSSSDWFYDVGPWGSLPTFPCLHQFNEDNDNVIRNVRLRDTWTKYT